MQKIKIVCPAGSGMNFALNLLRLSFNNQFLEITTAGHERKDIAEEVPTLVILRNPYDAIASGAERWLRTSEHVYFKDGVGLIEEDNKKQIVDQILREKERYLEFFTDIEDLKHVKIIDFDTLTKNPDLFVKKVAEHFGIEYKITPRSEDEVIKAVIDSGNANRVPRAKSSGREKVDRYTKALFPEDEFKSLKVYLDLKRKIEEGLI